MVGCAMSDISADKDYNIPKVIHYCWFGGGPKSELMLKCLQSWKQYFPTYEIIEWNESNYDVNQNAYCKEAYENKKWAFVSDYARLDIIYKYGGIYFDTDVEVQKNFEDKLINYGYLGFENCSNVKDVATGLGFAAKAGDPVVRAMLTEYDDIHFINDGILDLTPCPKRNTAALVKLGLIPDGTMQIIGNIKIYPFEYFCGIDIANSHPYITENTCTVHHYSATWREKAGFFQRIKYNIIVPILQKLLGYERYDQLISFKHRND